jgi:hypothetical protein
MATKISRVGNVVKLNPLADRLKSEPDVIVSVETITPQIAADWLKCNRLNRPVRQSHVHFLAREMTADQWQLNGQAIIICDNEDVLDGQHRLLAVIESGCPIRTLVIYGVKREAFKTIDTGIVRTSADALAVWFPGKGVGITKTVGAAIPWCIGLERGVIHEKEKLPNVEAIQYAKDHPSLWQCAEEVSGYPKDLRVLSTGMGTAAYEIFQRRDADKARDFIRAIYTGEMLEATEPEFILRALLSRDQQSLQKYPARTRMRMVVKAWNLRRRGVEKTSRQAVSVHARDSEEVVIL